MREINIIFIQTGFFSQHIYNTISDVLDGAIQVGTISTCRICKEHIRGICADCNRSEEVSINYALYGMQKLAQNVTGVKVPLSGHWTPEERPDLVNMLNNFFSGKPTSETSR